MREAVSLKTELTEIAKTNTLAALHHEIETLKAVPEINSEYCQRSDYFDFIEEKYYKS